MFEFLSFNWFIERSNYDHHVKENCVKNCLRSGYLY